MLHFLRISRSVDYIPNPIIINKNQSILSYSNALNSFIGIENSIKSADARPLLLAKFLQKYNSPLKPYDYWGVFLVSLADKYTLDYRLLPSIAMQESNLCKVIPENTYNCLGLGIHSQGTWGFKSFEANFEKAAEILKFNYLDKGYISPEEIQLKYTPQSNGSWQAAVNHFMDKIENGEF